MKRTKEQIISEKHHDAFTKEIKALLCRKGLPKKSSILTYTPMVTDGILRSNTRLRCSNDLPDETKYHHETEGHEMGLHYTLNQGRGRPRVKRYLCLFVCLQTHCCHLEMASSLETDAFLNALTRMVARKGWPKLMFSDNGTNYVGAAREIKELVKNMDRD